METPPPLVPITGVPPERATDSPPALAYGSPLLSGSIGSNASSASSTPTSRSRRSRDKRREPGSGSRRGKRRHSRSPVPMAMPLCDPNAPEGTSPAGLEPATAPASGAIHDNVRLAQPNLGGYLGAPLPADPALPLHVHHGGVPIMHTTNNMLAVPSPGSDGRASSESSAASKELRRLDSAERAREATTKTMAESGSGSLVSQAAARRMANITSPGTYVAPREESEGTASPTDDLSDPLSQDDSKATRAAATTKEPVTTRSPAEAAVAARIAAANAAGTPEQPPVGQGGLRRIGSDSALPIRRKKLRKKKRNGLVPPQTARPDSTDPVRARTELSPSKGGMTHGRTLSTTSILFPNREPITYTQEVIEDDVEDEVSKHARAFEANEERDPGRIINVRIPPLPVHHHLNPFHHKKDHSASPVSPRAAGTPHSPRLLSPRDASPDGRGLPPVRDSSPMRHSPLYPGDQTAPLPAIGVPPGATGPPSSVGGDDEHPLHHLFLPNYQPHHFPNNKIRTAKYTVLSFLPRNLFEQFRRLANLYFLLISGLQMFTSWSPTGRYTTFGPLLFVLSLTAIKEAYEDVKRHKTDRIVNNRLVTTLRENAFMNILWRDLHVGDIVCVHNGEDIPADIVLLSTSEPTDVCYVETSNLDGETNMKIHQAPIDVGDYCRTPEMLSDLSLRLECEKPNARLYNFDGVMWLAARPMEAISLTAKHLILRGSQVRNTAFVYGVVVYTGHDSKLMKNATPPPSKRTLVERETNRFILSIFIFQIVLCIVSAVLRSAWASKNGTTSWYLDDQNNSVEEGVVAFFTFLILYNNLIPISLYVSMEIVKFAQAAFINWDLQMYSEERATPAEARTSNLNEELGLVEYIFSDKTGTLTRNVMEFRKCSVHGRVFEDFSTAMREVTDANGHIDYVEVPDFDSCRMRRVMQTPGSDLGRACSEMLELLAVCHSIIPELSEETGELMYRASSPDESALARAAQALGFNFVRRTPREVTVAVSDDILAARGGVSPRTPLMMTTTTTTTTHTATMTTTTTTQKTATEIKYEVLDVIDFTSTRKRMSVIVRTPEGKIKLFCKGADAVIFERLSDESLGSPTAAVTERHLAEFAGDGLRTLCCAVTELTKERYRAWSKTFRHATTAVKNREAKVAAAAEEIERDLRLIGATAIEDKLQQGVPETIATLAEAGLKIWVLTGDKQETAINIGHSCHLLRTDMKVMIVNELSDLGTLARIDTYNKEKVGVDPDNLALVINGTSLHHALAICPKAFVRLAKNCKAVICCRVSPLQKALVVELIKKNLNTITLAIGDGANDVGMLTAAHVGVGISGEEGLQAVRSSDYSIAQFRFLERLLLIHGRHSYRRIAKLICYSFYKNILLYMTQFWYIFENGYSGQSLYEGWTIAVYNIFFTSLPILVLAILDKDVSDRMVSKYPRIYRFGQKHVFLTGRIFWGWTLNALFHSLLVYLLISNIWRGGSLDSGGQGFGLMDMGMVMYICVVIIVTLKLGLETYYWTIYNHVAMWGSLVAVVIFFGVYCTAWSWGFLSLAPSLYWVFMRLFVTPVFWWAILLVPTVALLRDIGWKAFMRAFRPKAHHLLQEMAVKKRRRRDPDPENGKSNDDAVGGHRHGHSAHHGHHGHHHHGHHHHGHHNSHASADGAKGKGKHSSHNHHHHHHHHHRRTLSNQHSRHHGSHHARGRQSPRIGAFNPLRLSPPPSSMPPGVEMTTTIPTTPNKLATREETIGGGQTMTSGSAVGVPAHLPPLVGSGTKRAPKVPPPSVVVAPPIEPDEPMQRVSVLDDDAISEADHRRTRSHS